GKPVAEAGGLVRGGSWPNALRKGPGRREVSMWEPRKPLVVRALVVAGFACLALRLALYDRRYILLPFGGPMETALAAAGIGLDALAAWVYFRKGGQASPSRPGTAVDSGWEVFFGGLLSYAAAAAMWLVLVPSVGREPSEALARWVCLRQPDAALMVAAFLIGPAGAAVGTVVAIAGLVPVGTGRRREGPAPAGTDATTYALAAALGALVGILVWPVLAAVFWVWSDEAALVVLMLLMGALGAPVGGLVGVALVAACSAYGHSPASRIPTPGQSL